MVLIPRRGLKTPLKTFLLVQPSATGTFILYTTVLIDTDMTDGHVRDLDTLMASDRCAHPSRARPELRTCPWFRDPVSVIVYLEILASLLRLLVPARPAFAGGVRRASFACLSSCSGACVLASPKRISRRARRPPAIKLVRS